MLLIHLKEWYELLLLLLIKWSERKKIFKLILNWVEICFKFIPIEFFKLIIKMVMKENVISF